MAFVTGSQISTSAPISTRGKAINLSSVYFFTQKRSFPSNLRLNVSCPAKKETVDKVCEIVKKQLALPEGTSVTGESKFTDLGADSLDTVEIVMELEGEFDVSLGEDQSNDIATVGDAANVIEKLCEKK